MMRCEHNDAAVIQQATVKVQKNFKSTITFYTQMSSLDNDATEDKERSKRLMIGPAAGRVAVDWMTNQH